VPKVMKLAIGSLFVGVIVLAIKMLAYWMTGSIALFSDALESVVNVATAIAALVAIRIAARPADATHPYGHHKAEFMSAVLEGVLIIVAALVILHEAYQGILAPRHLDAPFPGLMVNVLASVINGIWCWVLIRQGTRERSPALVADGKHLLSDVISSVGVTFGVFFAVLSGWAILDPLMAALVALNILWSGWAVMKTSISGLLDESLSDEVLGQVRNIIAAEATGAVQAHDLRTRHAGSHTFLDFHLVVPGDATVHDAHEICDKIEAALKAVIPDASITIHVEPEDKAKKSGIMVL
jgi:cation diffusion facilitator family transporter